MESMNDNGERFASFCLEQGLMIAGFSFPYSKNHNVAWVSPDGPTENQVGDKKLCKRNYCHLM